MFECKSCGGNLKFDIASQRMKCEYCESQYDPYEVEESHEAQEVQMDVTVFICPECGGEIYSAYNSAAEFCSFCGASTVLNTRIQKEKRPKKIIPFKKTQEECNESYKKFIKKCLYAPKDLRSMTGKGEFRGIYMPYWSYSISHSGKTSVKGEKEYRDGDYIVTDYYDIRGDIDAHYDDLPYDSASNFSDDISERIAPYNTQEYQKFSPAFLSGFYADIADVNSMIYEKEAKKFANRQSLKKINSDPVTLGISVTSKDEDDNCLNTQIDKEEPVMMPVWFMAYRTKDRVSYATVNAQTGKIAADVPIDMRKFFIGTIPIYVIMIIILNLVLTLNGKQMLIGAGILSLLTVILYAVESSKIIDWETNLKDTGKTGFLDRFKKKTQDENGKNAGTKDYELPAGTAFMPSLIATGICVLIWFIEPHDDIWYYGAAVITFLCVLYTVIRLVGRFNIMTTRRLPQLGERGKEETVQNDRDYIIKEEEGN